MNTPTLCSTASITRLLVWLVPMAMIVCITACSGDDAPSSPVADSEDDGFVSIGVPGISVNTCAGPALTVHNWTLVAAANRGWFSEGYVVTWTPQGWKPTAESISGYVTEILTINEDLVIAGEFTAVDSVQANNIALWNGSEWKALGDGLPGAVGALGVYNGSLVAGAQTSPGSLFAAVYLWDGQYWNQVGDKFTYWWSGSNGAAIKALLEFDNHLIAGGGFRYIGQSEEESIECHAIAAWDGDEWRSIGTFLHYDHYESINCLVELNSCLIAGGYFSSVDGEAAGSVASWDGITWSRVGGGFSGFSSIVDLDVFFGTLVAGGNFHETADGRSAVGVSVWNGTIWGPLEGGVLGSPMGDVIVRDIHVHGSRLFAAGYFSWAFGRDAANVATWP